MSRALHSSPLYSHVRVVSGCPFWKLPIDLDTNVVSSYFKINVPFGLGKCAITYWFQGYNKNLEMDRYWIFLSVVCAPPPPPPQKENCRSNDSWSEARVGKLGLVNCRKEVWDCYRGQVFWATNVNRNWGLFHFKAPWRYQICIFKCLYYYRDNLSNIWLKPPSTHEKRPLSVDVHRSKTSLLTFTSWPARPTPVTIPEDFAKVKLVQSPSRL